MMKSNKNTLKKNILYNSIYNIYIIIIPLVLSPYLSRTLGVAAIGIFSFTFAVANYFKRFSLLGMEKYGNRSIALVKNDNEKKRSSFWGIYKIQFVCSLFCLLVYFIYIAFFNKMGLTSIIQSLFILSAMFDVSWYFFGNENFKPVVIILLIFKTIYLILTFIFIKQSKDINLYTFISAISYLLPNLIIFIIAVIKEKYISNTKEQLKLILRGTLLLFIPVIAVTLYKSMDKVMLGIICKTTFENGLYENAEKIIHVPISIIAAISTVMMPRMTQLYRDHKEEKAYKLIDNTIWYSSFVGIACSFGLFGISNIFANVFWGSDFSECGILLKLFSISIPFMCFAEIIRSQYIIPNKKDNIYIKAVCLGAILNLIINILMIPKFGARGAVIGTIISEAIVCSYQTFKIRKDINTKNLIKEYLKFFPYGLIMGMALYYIGNQITYSICSLLIMIFIGAILYSTLIFLHLFLFDKEKLESILLLIKKKFSKNNN